MTSRERVLAAIRHQETDKVPVDLGAMRSTGITALAHVKLRKHLGLAGKVRLHDLVQQLAQPEDEILDRFGIDVVDVGRAFLTSDDDWHEWTLQDGSPCLVPYYFTPERAPEGGWLVRDGEGEIIARQQPDAFYFSQTLHPLNGKDPSEFASLLPGVMAKVSWGGIPSPPFHLALDDEGLAAIAERAKWLYETSDRAILIHFGGNLLEWGQYLRGFDTFLMDLLADPPAAERLLDCLLEIHMDGLQRLLKAVGPYVQIIQFGDDLGTSAGPQIDPECYRTLFKPRHAKMFQYARAFGGPHVFLHSCGAIRPFMRDLIEAGVEIFNPVQVNAHGMDPQELKREFGDEITFWGGGCAPTEGLSRGTPETVRRVVLDRLKIFSEGGGFVFNQVHNITPEVPPENVVAMLDAVGEFNQNR